MPDYVEEAIRRYQSWAVTEYLGDMSEMFRVMFAPRHRVSINEVRNLQTLCKYTMRVMELDEKHVEEMLVAHFERKAREGSNHCADITTEGVCQSEQLSPGTG